MPLLLIFYIRQVDDTAFNSEVLTVEEGDGGKRLDAFLGARMPEQSRSYFGGLCQLGLVTISGKAAKKSVKVEQGQEVEVRFVVSPELSLQGEDIPLDVSLRSRVCMAIPFETRVPPFVLCHVRCTARHYGKKITNLYFVL